MTRRLIYLYFGLLTAFLATRSLQSNRFSEWTWADAQSLNAIQNWKNLGFFNQFFFPCMQGESKNVELLDDPQLSHHANGVRFEMDGHLVGKRLYTHYPNGWLYPHAALGYLGVEDHRIQRLLACSFSLVGLFFFFLFLSKQFGAGAALIAAVLYSLHAGFLGYGDAFSSMPSEDLLRFSFLYVWFRFRQSVSSIWLRLSYFVFFLNVLCSFDSILFCGFFVITYDFLFHKKFDFRNLAGMGTVCVVTFALIFLQNIRYMGWDAALADWGGTLLKYSTRPNVEIPLWWKLGSRWHAAVYLAERSFSLTPWVIATLFGIAAFLNRRRPEWNKWLLIFFVLGLTYPLAFPTKARIMPYLSRMFTPFASLLFAMLIMHIASYFRDRRYTRFVTLTAFVCWTIYLGFLKPIPYFADFPPKLRVLKEDKDFAEALRSQVPGEKVVFQLVKALPILDQWNDTPQVDPQFEYFAKSLILSFEKQADLTRDLKYLWAHKKVPFAPVLVVDSAQAKQMLDLLRESSIRAERVVKTQHPRLVAYELSMEEPLTAV